LKPLIAKLPFTTLDKKIINDRLKSFWFRNSQGFNVARQLLSTVQSMKKEVISESFDELAAKYASSFNLDINDFMIDLQEVHSLLENSEKRFKKVVKNKKTGRTKTVRYGQAGKAKDGGDRIRPGTSKGDAYCARSNKIKGDWRNDPNSPNRLSRKKWKCKGDKSVK
jgi:hypothetical protein